MTNLRLLSILCLLGALGCAHTKITRAPSLDEKKPNKAILGPGDVIDLRIFEEKELSGMHQISSDGTVQLPLVGALRIINMSPQEAGSHIASEYKKKYLKNPEVSLFVQQFNSRKIYLLGEVKAPGPFPYEENMTLIGAIARAGGTTGFAAANRTVITRTEDGKQMKMTAKVADIGSGDAPDLPVVPGDIIFVPQGIF